MKVLIVHYHLNPGGVTRIIEAQINGLKAFNSNTEITVLCGNANDLQEIGGIKIKSDHSLYYRDDEELTNTFEEAVNAIVSCLKRSLTKNSILHFHNPNLGKNPCLTLAVYRLAQEGHPVINHCHDFPEDRPANLSRLERTIPGFSNKALQEVLYPDFPGYHFIVLNSCDHERILRQNVSPSRVHLLPNPVSLHKKNIPPDKQYLKREICRILDFDSAKKLCTYPVRAIERKNLGEFILFAVLFADVAHFAVTLAPKNSLELQQYEQWKTFCNENRIAVKFEAGNAILRSW
jgi:glycosyltransferase involved in cell wall biosynthesis